MNALLLSKIAVTATIVLFLTFPWSSYYGYDMWRGSRLGYKLSRITRVLAASIVVACVQLVLWGFT